MYDAVTAELIKSSPLLEGLDRETLPDLFSKAFAEIAAARIRLREVGDEQANELSELIAMMRRIANTNEALLAVLPQRDDRVAAAFVAATAHQLVAQADRELRGIVASTRLSERSISSDIAAMLLFMVAEATADAAEIAKSVNVESEDTIERALIVALVDFCSARLMALTGRELPRPQAVAAEDSAGTANASLYWLILRGVRSLSRNLLDVDPAIESSPSAIFEHARSLSVGEPGAAGEELTGVVSSFPGPQHLASLLLAVSRDISGGAVTHIPPPSGIDPDAWAKSMRRLAESKPLLWRNHREAVELGYLDFGISAVVGFPTGAGKSTLAELKINTALLAGKKVVFLAPTNALVDQTSSTLRSAFPTASVQGERSDELGALFEDEELPEIFVMTPEACLFQLSIDPTIFEDVGLFVFDECHLMHPTDTEGDRRAIDAMLCTLNFSRVAPDSDFLLLSAMMKNADSLAGWIGELTGRPCLSLDLAWKPTRQLRGSVIYEQDRVNLLERTLDNAVHNRTTKYPPVALKRQLTAEPLALFSLKQTWATRNREDYTLVSLREKRVTLGANQYWKLTPNAVEVSAAIAVAAAQSGIKSLVFFQTIRNARSAADRISDALHPVDIKLYKEERGWYETAVLELGGADHLYLDVEGSRVSDGASVHHGLLLPEERRLCEALYKRKEGLSVLAATSTLAEGMNLPCELVIIGEDSRFDQAKDKREVLAAQELLNAAGRAGRAGESAGGIVLVVPGRVVGVDFEAATIGEHWNTLREIFGQSDQCVDIEDPLAAILDRVHGDVRSAGEIERYTLTRLAARVDGSASEDLLSNRIDATFGAYMARLNGEAAWLKERKHSATQYLKSRSDEDEDELIEGQVAAGLGLSVDLVRRLSKALTKGEPDAESNVREWRKWLFRWLSDNPDLVEKAFRRQGLVGLFGKRRYEGCRTDEDRAKLVLPTLRKMTWLWMKGEPLRELEIAVGTKEKDVKTCEKARQFAVRIVPDLAYLFSLPALLHERAQAVSEESRSMLPAKTQLGRCVRMGLNAHEKVALDQVLRSGRLSRRRIHMRYSQIKPFLKQGLDSESWEETLERVEGAVDAELLARG